MKTILLVGSSIFEAWSNAARVAPGHAVKNRAIGGTITSYWREHLAEVLTAELPDAVLFYCGSNDVSNDIPEEEIIANVSRCQEIVSEHSPDTAFAWFSIIKAPQKNGKWELIDRLNATVRAGLSAGDLYVESNDVFLQHGLPVEEFFVEDGLHLTDEAYNALTVFAEPIITDWL